MSEAPFTIRKRLDIGFKNLVGPNYPDTNAAIPKEQITQKEAFFAGHPFTLFPLGAMPIFKYEPSLCEEHLAPYLIQIWKGMEQDSSAIIRITETDFTIHKRLLGLYEWTKTIPFTELNFVKGWNGHFDSTSRSETVISPSEDTLQRVELENSWMIIQPQSFTKSP